MSRHSSSCNTHAFLRRDPSLHLEQTGEYVSRCRSTSQYVHGVGSEVVLILLRTTQRGYVCRIQVDR